MPPLFRKYSGFAALLAVGWLAGRQVWPRLENSAGSTETAGVSPPAGALEERSDAGNTAKPADGKVDPVAAARAVRTETGEHALRDAARRMALAPPPALADFLALATDSETVRAALLEDAVRWAYYRNPAAGLAQFSALPESPAAEAIVNKALRFFPPKDLPTVLAWYEKLPAGRLRLAALAEITPVLARRDFAKAAALTAALPQGDEAAKQTRRDRMKQLLVGGRGMQTLAVMEKKLEAFPPEEKEFLRGAIQGAQFRNLANNSPEDAVTFLTGLPPDEYADRGAVLFQEWAERDPIHAAREIDRVPEAMRTEALYSGFAAAWTEGNVGMASQWVDGLPAGRWREAATRGLVRGLTKDYPAEALTWAATITDPVERAESLRALFSQAAVEKRSALLLSLESTPLQPEEKEAARKSLSP